MGGRHTRYPLSVRLPEELEEWLRSEAEAAGESVGSLVTRAVEEYRQRRDRR